MDARSSNLYAMCILLLLLCGCADTKSRTPRIVLDTSQGPIVVELYPDKAPVTVANFLRYVDEAAFGGASFYRVTRPENDPTITVIQGGLWRPWQKDTIKHYVPPFPSIPHETTQSSGLSHTDGVISMGRLAPGTANSEFFICVGDNPALDFGGARNPDGQGFAAFGRVIEGMSVVRAIYALPTEKGEGFKGQILQSPVTISAVGYAAH